MLNNKKNKILIVDDDAGILEALGMILNVEGYEVETSAKGETAEDLVVREKGMPDLIILDIFLSGKDGRNIAKILKASDNTRSIPIIIMSAHPGVIETIHQCGAEEFLSKPFETEELFALIDKYRSKEIA